MRIRVVMMFRTVVKRAVEITVDIGWLGTRVSIRDHRGLNS